MMAIAFSETLCQIDGYLEFHVFVTNSELVKGPKKVCGKSVSHAYNMYTACFLLEEDSLSSDLLL